MIATTEKLCQLKNIFPCKIVSRLNRFVVMVKIDGKKEKAYITNTGRLKEYLYRGSMGYCTEKKKGKNRYQLIAIKDGEQAALIDTRLQMMCFEKALSYKAIKWLGQCSIVKRNPRVYDSLLDYLLECEREKVWVEVKSAAFRSSDGCAMYPDCPTIRGRRHIKTLIRLSEEGKKSIILFIAAVPGAKCFRPYPEGDPFIPPLLREANTKGVLVKAISLHFNPHDGTVIMDETDLPVYI